MLEPRSTQSTRSKENTWRANALIQPLWLDLVLLGVLCVLRGEMPLNR